MSPLCTEVLHLHVSHSGEVSAINYDQELCPCHSEAVRSLELPRNFTFAEEVKVPVLLPTLAHPVLLTPKPQQAAGEHCHALLWKVVARVLAAWHVQCVVVSVRVMQASGRAACTNV